MQADFDKDVLTYFTDVEHLREIFKNLVAAPTLAKRLLVIHGVGGVGKSSLLRMFRLHCKSVNVPVALASGDEAKSALDVLTRWTEDLKADGVAFPTFGKTYEHYRAIQAKVDEQAKKAQDARSRAADIVGKAASKTAEAAGGALAGAAIGSIVPGIGTAIGGALGGVLGGMGAEAMVDWLYGFLTKPDIDLLLDPAKKLTDDFLTDIAKAAGKRRIVLMLDTFEQMTVLEDWVREVAQRLHVNTLFVIAGRAVPNWSRAWQSWMVHAQVEELKPMTEDDMRELVRRYYATMRGGEPNLVQVEAIIRFARGLPMVVTSAVQLWVKYGIEDFQAIKPEIVANLVDRLMEGAPKPLIPVLEAAAIVRWFDQPILRAMMKQDDVRDVYNELRRFPFVRTRVEGLALHDAVREIMDENLRAQDSERHCELHQRAAAYFQDKLSKLATIPGLSDEWQRLTLEISYHLILADEIKGIDFLHNAFGQGLMYFRYQFCRQLLNNGESSGLSNPRSLHLLKFDKIRLTIAEFSPAYVAQEEFDEIVANSRLDPTSEWEVFLKYANFLGFAAKPDQQASYLRRSLVSLQTLGMEESAAGCIILSAVASTFFAEPTKRIELAKRALEISQRIGAPFFAYNPYVELGHVYLDIGDYPKAEMAWRAALEIAKKHSNDARIADALNRLAHALMAMGRLSEAEEVLNSAMTAAKQLPETLGAGLDKQMYIKRHFGMLYQMRKDYDKAIQYYSESAQIYRQRRSTGGRLRTLVLLAGCLFEAGRGHEIGNLVQEIEQCATPLRNSEMAASWQAIQGHLLMSQAINGESQADAAVTKYGEALKTALEAHITGVYEIANRIFWRLGLLKSDANLTMPYVLQGLTEFWKQGRSGDQSLISLESEKRRKFIGGSTEIYLAPDLLSQFDTALKQGLLRRTPAPWLAY